MLAVSLRSVNCRFWSSMRVFGVESFNIYPFKYGLGLCMGIYKKCHNTDHTEIKKEYEIPIPSS